jgi:hypothetical protein
MTQEKSERLSVVRSINDQPLSSRFWPASSAYIAESTDAGNLDLSFGFEIRCGNAGGCNPEALSRAIKQRLGRLGWRIEDSALLDAELVAEQLPVGIHKVRWDANSLACGVYFYRLQAGEFVQVRKVILMK